MHDRFETLVVNDLDYAIAAFWQCVTDPSLTRELIRKVESTQPTAEERARQREIYFSRPSSLVDAAFAALFLSRTGFSGILIGGSLRDIGSRWNPDRLAGRISDIHRLLGPKLIVCNLDFQTVLNRYDLPACVIYCDPPYYVKGDQLYREKMAHFDHARLANALAHAGHAHWLLSYDDAPEIRSLYSGWANIAESVFAYSITGGGQSKTELMISPYADPRPVSAAVAA